MKKAPIPKNEPQRLEELKSYEILDTPRESIFDEITKTAASICETPIAFINLFDDERLWCKSSFGIEFDECPREITFCGHVIEVDDLMIVEDASKDERFCDNPFHTEAPFVAFYAGTPLTNENGFKLGSLCVVGPEAKTLTEHQKLALKSLSRQVVTYLEIKKQNKYLKKVQKQFDEIQEISKAGYWELDVKSGLTTWTKQVYKIHNVEYGTPTHKIEAISFYAPHERPRLNRLLDLAIKEKRPYDGDFEFYNSKGEFLWVRGSGRPVLDKNGNVTKLIGTFQDVTESKLNEKLAYHNAKLTSLGRLAAGVGHEINNPLTVISGHSAIMTNLMENDVLDKHKLEKSIHKIEKAVDRITTIISGLKTFSRKDNAQLDSIDLVAVVEETVGMVEEIYSKEFVKFSLKLCDSAIVFGNSGKLQQVLMNIIANAKDALIDHDNALIEVLLEQKSEKVILRISDNGSGIPDNIREKIFDPFYTSKPVQRGTGLGLSLCHQIISDHDGKILVDSEMGVGSTFTIELKAAAIEEKRIDIEGAKSSVKSDLLQGSVLLAEDEEDVREVMVAILEETGLEVVGVPNGEEAYKLYVSDPSSFDMIFSDMQMPKMGGKELIEKIRSNKNIKQPILCIVSGGVNIDWSNPLNEWVNLIDAYIQKPFKSNEIREVVKGLLEVKTIKKAS